MGPLDPWGSRQRNESFLGVSDFFGGSGLGFSALGVLGFRGSGLGFSACKGLWGSGLRVVGFRVAGFSCSSKSVAKGSGLHFPPATGARQLLGLRSPK